MGALAVGLFSHPMDASAASILDPVLGLAWRRLCTKVQVKGDGGMIKEMRSRRCLTNHLFLKG